MSGTALPDFEDFHCVARGGPAYASCAVLWRRKSQFAITHVPDIGTDRQIWLAIVRGGVKLFACMLYLPPGNSSTSEKVWSDEVEGIRQSILKLNRETPDNTTAHFLLIGDWNFQPSSLGGGADPKPMRQRLFDCLLNEADLTILNPALGGDQGTSIDLPCRQASVKVRAGDTHHGGGIAAA